MKENLKITIIGLGYIGLPIFESLYKKKFKVCAVDNNSRRVEELKNGIDRNNTIKIGKKKKLFFNQNIYSNYKLIKDSNVFIVTLPTPIYGNKKPNLSTIIKCCNQLSKIIKANDLIIFESTVAPGTTETIFINNLLKYNNLKSNQIHLGYSPERINPGRGSIAFSKINKIISSNTTYGLRVMDYLYSNIIQANVTKVKSIKEAETSKILENIQRDVNISLMNEMSKFCIKMNINFNEVLRAASTKWNFVNYKPGLVGGHCIGVDPYYFIDMYKKLGFSNSLIELARINNEKMTNYTYKKIKINIDKLKNKNIKILLLGLTFKENCPDFRNSKNLEIANSLNHEFKNIYIHDPYIANLDHRTYDFNIYDFKTKNKFDCIIILVSHDDYKKPFNFYSKILNKDFVFIDINNLIDTKHNSFSLK